jgi:hypothetical protein
MIDREGSSVVPVSAFMHPTGPEPASVYWIRRGAIILVVITVLVAFWWLIGSLRGGGAESPAGSDPQPSTSVSAAPEGSSDPSPSASAGGEPVECLDSAITVEATTDASTYPIGSTPRLTLTIINSGSVACKRDVGPKANELEITSGGYHVWSSDDCNASSKSKVVVLEPGEKVASSITWNGRLTQKGCPDGEGDAAKAGRYDLVGRNGKVTSESTPFALTAA